MSTDIEDEVEVTSTPRQPNPGRLPEGGTVAGRPVEDRGFEVVETGVGLVAGIAVGAAVGGPIGAAIGGIVGAAGAFAAGEALERAEGRAATTTDAVDEEPEPEPAT